MSLSIDLKINIDTCDGPFEATIYEVNIDHSLSQMAAKCDLYDVMWKPSRLYNIEEVAKDNFHPIAGDLIEALEYGIKELEDSPSIYWRYNGRDAYEDLLMTAKEYLEYCKNIQNH